MFEEILIEAVQKREAVYNKKCMQYRLDKSRIWVEISKEVGQTVDACKSRWKSLRDRFLREHVGKPSGSGADDKSKWEYYDQMSFLKCHIAPRKTSSNFAGVPLADEMSTQIKEGERVQSADIYSVEPCASSFLSLSMPSSPVPPPSPPAIAPTMHQPPQPIAENISLGNLSLSASPVPSSSKRKRSSDTTDKVENFVLS